jgi:hypothetical protein
VASSTESKTKAEYLAGTLPNCQKPKRRPKWLPPDNPKAKKTKDRIGKPHLDEGESSDMLMPLLAKRTQIEVRCASGRSHAAFGRIAQTALVLKPT